MVNACAVVSCTNNCVKNRPLSRKFHKFPDNEEQRNIWLKLCGKSGSYLKTLRICSDHFEAEALHTLKCRMLKTNVGNNRCGCKVSEGIVPTLNLPETVEVLKTLSQQIQLKNSKENSLSRKALVEELLSKPYSLEPINKKNPREKLCQSAVPAILELAQPGDRVAVVKDTPPPCYVISTDGELSTPSRDIYWCSQTVKAMEPPKKKKRLNIITDPLSEEAENLLEGMFDSRSNNNLMEFQNDMVMINVPKYHSDLTADMIVIKDEPLELQFDDQSTNVFEDLCRICARKSDNMVQIFGMEGLGLELKFKINTCLPITVDELDELPLEICRVCLSHVQQSFRLAKTCEVANVKLTQILACHQNVDYLEESDPLETCLEPQQEPCLEPQQESCLEPHQESCFETVQESCLEPEQEAEEEEELIAEEPKKINIKLNTENAAPPKLSFEFVRAVPSKKLPTKCKLCNLTLFSVKVAQHHYSNVHHRPVCEFCFEVFEANEKLVKHVNKVHLHTCKVCNFKIIGLDNSLLKNHVRNVHGKRPSAIKKALKVVRNNQYVNTGPKKFSINCKFCYKLFDSKILIKQHYLAKHNKHTCVFCWVDFSSAEVLQKHIELMKHSVICDLCSQECSTPRGLQQHLSVVHPTGELTPLVECDLCDFAYYNKNSLRVHYIKQHEVFPCMVCDVRFDSMGQLEGHKRTQGHLECSKCGERFDNYDFYKEHMDSHDLKTCPQCQKTFTTNSALQSHVRYIHQKQPHPYSCTLCPSKFRGPLKLRQHLARHRQEKNVRCEVCDKCFYDDTALKVHSLVHSEERNFACDRCDAKFKHHRNLHAHVSGVHMAWEYVCAVCNKSFPKETEVFEHFKGHSQEETSGFEGKPFTKMSPHKCEVCNKYFASKLYLTMHEKRHNKNNTAAGTVFKCECQKIFSTKQSLAAHFSVAHLSNKLFQCPLCEKPYRTSEGLKKHVKSHNEAKTYPCKYCNKEFSKSQNLGAHLRNVHYKTKKYKCLECEKSFSQPNHLKQHAAVHTGAKDFVCDSCPKQFTQIGDLRRHKASKHPDKLEYQRQVIETCEDNMAFIILTS